MNRIFAPPPLHPPPRTPTRAADGLPRWRWTVAEIEKMSADGYFHDEERFELVGGEIVPMAAKGRRHELIRGALALRLTRATPEHIFVVSEPQFNVTDDTYLNPDVLVHPAAVKTPDVRGPDTLLVVEVADTSLRCDVNTKAPIYAGHGVREYWVINAATLATLVHREPTGTKYASVQEIASDARLVPSLVPGFGISLSTLDLD